MKSSSFKLQKKPSFSKLSNLEIEEKKEETLIEMKDMTEKDNKGKTPQDFYIHRKKSVLAMLDTLKRKNIQVKEGEEV